MDSASKSKIRKLPPRPTAGDLLGANSLTVSIGVLLIRNRVQVLTGGTIGSFATVQKLTLEMAVRNYFLRKGLDVIYFSRAPRAVSVGFRYAPGAYWTVESVMPDDLNLSPEDRDDWLYGSLVKNNCLKLSEE